MPNHPSISNNVSIIYNGLLLFLDNLLPYGMYTFISNISSINTQPHIPHTVSPSPALLPSPLALYSIFSSWHLKSFKHKPTNCTFKSHSHLTSLSLLLLLAAGDISPNPGPVPSPSLPHTKLSNLISIPSKFTHTPPFRCALWKVRYVCSTTKSTFINDFFISNSSIHLLALTETWLSPFNSSTLVSITHGGLQFRG